MAGSGTSTGLCRVLPCRRPRRRRVEGYPDPAVERAVRDIREVRRELSLMYMEMEDIAETLPPRLRRRAEKIIDMFLDAKISAKDALQRIRRLKKLAEKEKK